MSRAPAEGPRGSLSTRTTPGHVGRAPAPALLLPPGPCAWCWSGRSVSAPAASHTACGSHGSRPASAVRGLGASGRAAGPHTPRGRAQPPSYSPHTANTAARRPRRQRPNYTAEQRPRRPSEGFHGHGFSCVTFVLMEL